MFTKVDKKYEEKIFDAEYIRFLIAIFIVFLVLFKGVLLLSYVVSGSMSPTLIEGDLLICNRLAYISDEPQRGDIIAFDSDGTVYVKRVVGIAGDNIEVKYGTVKINGIELDESEYLPEGTLTRTGSSFEYTVPENCVFVMGDWRWASYDSRFWEEPYISLDNILGKGIFSIPTHKIREYFGVVPEYYQYLEHEEELQQMLEP